jgi:hypothetical protein
MQSKSQKILKAITAGHSCDQILANDGTLTYHDIFHVVKEVPTSFWTRESAGKPGKGFSGHAISVRRRVKHIRD